MYYFVLPSKRLIWVWLKILALLFKFHECKCIFTHNKLQYKSVFIRIFSFLQLEKKYEGILLIPFCVFSIPQKKTFLSITCLSSKCYMSRKIKHQYASTPICLIASDQGQNFKYVQPNETINIKISHVITKLD